MFEIDLDVLALIFAKLFQFEAKKGLKIALKVLKNPRGFDKIFPGDGDFL